MEKIVCALWRKDGEDAGEFAARLLDKLPEALTDAGASGIRLNLRDAAVAPAAGLIQQWQEPQQDAVVQFWLPTANARFRGAIDAVLAEQTGRFAAWLVSESTVIANDDAKRGWSQASFITFRSDIPREEAIAHWHGHHTQVAIETQANFEYVQNMIVMPLTENAPAYDAFVEECFPDAAMSDPAAFFDADGDPERFGANLSAMMDSCQTFIDFARIDIIPTSQFDFADKREEVPA
ncbi:MAG: EthD domain-containing protein [Novosphingobium sp.]